MTTNCVQHKVSETIAKSSKPRHHIFLNYTIDISPQQLELNNLATPTSKPSSTHDTRTRAMLHTYRPHTMSRTSSKVSNDLC